MIRPKDTDDTDEFVSARGSIRVAMNPQQDQLQAEFVGLCERAKANGLWEWFKGMVDAVVKAVREFFGA